jgi:hypothetical protein
MMISAERVNNVKFIKLKSGKIVRQVEEQYLRSDIPCGLANCPLCDKNESRYNFIHSYRLQPKNLVQICFTHKK